MAAGCVPCALGSFASVRDVLGSGGGVVVPAPYDAAKFGEAVAALMRDEARLAATAEKARAAAKAFTVERVVDQWQTLLEGL